MVVLAGVILAGVALRRLTRGSPSPQLQDVLPLDAHRALLLLETQRHIEVEDNFFMSFRTPELALQSADGSTLRTWTFPENARISAVAADDRVAVRIARDESVAVQVLDLRDGHEHYRHRLPAPRTATPGYDAHLDGLTPEERAACSRRDHAVTTTLLDGEHYEVLAGAPPRLLALDPGDGSARFDVALPGTHPDGPWWIWPSGDVLLVETRFGHGLLAVTRGDGAVRHVFEDGRRNLCALGEELLYVTEEGDLRRLAAGARDDRLVTAGAFAPSKLVGLRCDRLGDSALVHGFPADRSDRWLRVDLPSGRVLWQLDGHGLEVAHRSGTGETLAVAVRSPKGGDDELRILGLDGVVRARARLDRLDDLAIFTAGDRHVVVGRLPRTSHVLVTTIDGAEGRADAALTVTGEPLLRQRNPVVSGSTLWVPHTPLAALDIETLAARGAALEVNPAAPPRVEAARAAE